MLIPRLARRLFPGTSAVDRQPVPPSVRQFDPPVRRSPLRAWWEVRRSVKAGMPLQDYLAGRLGIYGASAPQGRLPLPWQLRVAAGHIDRVPNADAAADPRLGILADPAGVQEGDDPVAFAAEVQALRAMNRARSLAVLRDLEEEEARIGQLSARLADVQAELEEGQTEQVKGLGEGTAMPAATLRRPPEERGKPALDSAWPLVGLWTLVGGGIIGEAWQYFAPFADLTGVDR
ncbi:MAG: hypothetical protein AB1505_37230, partial [Candidatus Latescibacterota bacterium]